VGSGFRGPQGIQGNTGETGATGAQGDRAGLKYRFDTHTSPGAPSPGHLKFNSSTLSDVTRIAIRDTDLDGTSTSALLELIDDSTSAIKARVVIRSNSNSDTSHFNFLVTSVTDEGNHHHINGTYVSGSAFDSNEIVAFDFFVTGDKGDTGQTGPATELSVSGTTTGAAGTNASVTISGTAPNQSLAFTIPQGIQGIQGIQGPTGSSGATALLTGYVSSPGTVAATDTVIQAVGKLNGNDELKAPIASLYPYIGGKLLTYLDEEAAIADPLISAGDIYRKTAGGVDYVNPDNVPSLDLRFATDKTLTARRGPTPTFTRGSGATYIGSDGLIHGIDTSATSNSISAASKTFVLDATAGQDQFWRAGDAVEASSGANIMAGTVTSYNAATQSLVCNMTTVSGSGTFTSWRIGYRGPRFDHDPTSPFACRGLLIEEGRTNLFSSTNLNDWATARVTKTAITGIGLTNQATTLTISETGSTYIYRSATLTNGVAYAISVRVKAGTVASCGFGDLVDTKYSRSFNLSTNQWAASGGAVEFTNYTVTPNIDGWFLVSAIYTPTGATGVKNIAFVLNSTTLGQTVSFDTPQIEAGSFPTSYIPTTTGTLARSADVCTITGGDFNNFYNQSEGTLFADVSGLMPDVLGGNRGFAVITDGTYNNQIGIYKVASAAFIGAAGNTGNVSQFTLNNAYVPFTQYKVALGVKTNDTNAAFNGSLKTTDTSVTLPSTMNRLEFRDATGAAGGQPSCHIAAIRYYRKRLPNAKLQALTA
jgi:hypothetical protein